jgi:carboxymethylenebutenolidase
MSSPPPSSPSPHVGTAYLTLPDSGEGPGVLVLHAWWGLTPFFKQVCDRLAEQGFVALAPDMFAGTTTGSVPEAQAMLGGADMDAMLDLVRSSALTLRTMPVTPDAPIGTLGFSMGASWALWLASRTPEVVDATVAFYGTQSVDMTPATSAFLGHFAEVDPYVDDDELTLLEADLHVLGKDVTFHHYPGTRHWFFEEDRDAYDEAAARVAWERTLTFLHDRLRTGDAEPEGDEGDEG